MPHFEIEHKYLIRMPNLLVLGKMKQCTVTWISQTYLTTAALDTTERVRKRVGAKGTQYTHTIKRTISALTNEEDERIIDEATYLELLNRADQSRMTIEKQRFCIEEGGFCYEVDVYPFWSDRAVLEIEVPSETTQIPMPEYLNVIREITDDLRYKNAMLAKSLPMEQL